MFDTENVNLFGWHGCMNFVCHSSITFLVLFSWRWAWPRLQDTSLCSPTWPSQLWAFGRQSSPAMSPAAHSGVQRWVGGGGGGGEDGGRVRWEAATHHNRRLWHWVVVNTYQTFTCLCSLYVSNIISTCMLHGFQQTLLRLQIIWIDYQHNYRMLWVGTCHMS